MNPKKLFYSLSGGMVLIILGIGYGVYWANGQLRTSSTEISTKRTDLEILDAKVDNAQVLNNQLEDLRETQELVREVLPGSKSQENIVGELIAIASNRGVSLDEIAFSNGPSAPGAPEGSTAVKGINGVFSLTVNTSIETDYENILGFLEDLENNKRRFEVIDISITPPAEDTNTNLFGAQLTIVTYLKP
ncbi:MAG: hypothetical protein AAF413_03535 [Patescibacteria group bacterium]